MKLELIKYDNVNWLEATWKEIKTITLPQEVDENGMADMVLRTSEVETQVHCESFSGHPEHIAMLRNKALEYGTELDEAIIKELTDSYEAPTQAELDEEAKKAKLQEAYAYLASTDFKMTLDYDKDTTEIKVLRAEAREFIRSNNVPNT